MPKKALRRDLLERRRTMDRHAWESASRAAQQRLTGMDIFIQSRCVALYASIQQEIDTTHLFQVARSLGKKVLFPAVCGNRLQFRQVDSTDQLSSGAFGILEPCLLETEHLLEAADLIVVPGVAFDLQGHRIGFGKGYYDRCLSELATPAVLVGLCHDFQLLDQIPAEGHDIRMQYIVTDKRLIVPASDRGRAQVGKEAGTGSTPD